MADYGINGVRKKYVKIDFANGSRVFHYSKTQGTYRLSVLTGEGIVDDFTKEE